MIAIRRCCCLVAVWSFATIACIGADETTLPGTKPLQVPDDIVQVQLKQVTDYFKRRIAAAHEIRDKAWQADFSSPEAYRKSVAGHRPALRWMLGLVERPDFAAAEAKLEKLSDEPGCRVERVTIPMVEGLSARGLLFTPTQSGKSPAVIVCTDAENWPERFTGLLEDSATPGWLTELLARGMSVYVPQSIERLKDHPYCQQTKQKDRRWILYRLGYCVGRSMPGLDVAETLAAVDFLSQRENVDSRRIGIVGLGEGAMTSLFAAALDDRIDAVALVDSFESRDRCWNKPFDRRLRDRLLEFGDAELVALVAPRRLVIASSDSFRKDALDLEAELARAGRFFTGLDRGDRLIALKSDSTDAAFEQALGKLSSALSASPESSGQVKISAEVSAAVVERTRNLHFEERLAWLRTLVEASERKRYDRWKILQRPAGEFPEVKGEMLADYRRLVGRVPRDKTPLNPRTQLAKATDKYKCYRITLEVVRGVEVYGNLLVPVGIEGRRTAVICQQGLNGTPEMVTGLGMTKDTVFHEFGRKLAEKGYVVFAPLLLHHNPVQQITDQTRQADAVGMMRVAMPLAKTERIIDFLETLLQVDDRRIGYYGLSYGGYSAIWISPLCPRLAVTVVSGHFNDWRTKLTNDRLSNSFLLHPSEDMYDWNILHRFTHPELIAMIAPRPCCIEFGTRDAITTPEWTAYGWKQTKAIRDHLGLDERIILAEFDGTHEVRGEEAFDFVDRYLMPEAKPETNR